MSFDACGFPEDGPWYEIVYWQVMPDATSPSRSYSATPGFGEDEWVYSGQFYPEVWTLGTIPVVSDPAGILADVGSGDTLQLMLGFEELIDYDHATVCIEGRSVHTSSPVTVTLSNPTTSCSVSGQLTQAWTEGDPAHIPRLGLDIGKCFTPGVDTQALRVQGSGGSSRVGVHRLRITLHGASW